MDSKVFIKYILTVLLLYINPTKGCKGCVDLDDYNFEKVITKFPVTLVKFDVAYPYGEKHDIYGKFSEESSKINDLLFAEVGVKDYGEMDNENLAESYGITRDDYPAVRLYKKSTKDPISFPNDAEFTVDSLRTFVRDNTDIYIGLAGCLEQYDNLAKEFMTSEKQEDVLKKAEEVSNKLSEKVSFVKIFRAYFTSSLLRLRAR